MCEIDQIPNLAQLQQACVDSWEDPKCFLRLGEAYDAQGSVSAAYFSLLRAVSLGARRAAFRVAELDSLRKSTLALSFDADPEPGAPVVTVVMPTHGRSDRIAESIESVFNQTIRDIELIVVNDGGSRCLEGRLAKYAEKRLSYVRLEQNSGPSAARNAGIRKARGRYIAYLDDDDVFYPDHLETLVTHAERAGYDFVYSNCWRTRGVVHENIFTPKDRVLPRQPKEYSLAHLQRDNFISTLNVIHRRGCPGAVGGFDPGLRFLEDWEFWFRIAQRFKVGHVKGVTGEYRFLGSQPGVSSRHTLEMKLFEGLLREAHLSAYGAATLYMCLSQEGIDDVALRYLRRLDELVKNGYPIPPVLAPQIADVFGVALRRGLASELSSTSLHRILGHGALGKLRRLGMRVSWLRWRRSSQKSRIGSDGIA